MRQKHGDQWIGVNRSIGDPEISEFFGGITRDEIDMDATHINRKNATDALKIETKPNEATADEYISNQTPKTARGRNLKLEAARITLGDTPKQRNHGFKRRG